MDSNDTNSKKERTILYPELSYTISGLCFKVHNELGRFCRERQYADALEKLLVASEVVFEREKNISVDLIDNKATNKVDFSIEGKILVDLKAKPFTEKEDYYQMLRYLKASKYKLGLVVNFRNRYLKPKRIIFSERI